MQNDKNDRPFEQVLGLAGVGTTVAYEGATYRVHRYDHAHGAFCLIECLNPKGSSIIDRATLACRITYHIARYLRKTTHIPVAHLALVRRAMPVAHFTETETGFAERRMFLLSHYAEKEVGAIEVKREGKELLVENPHSQMGRMASTCFRALERAFGRNGLRLDRLVVRFGRAADNRLMVVNIFDHRDWTLRQAGRLLASPDALAGSVDADYGELSERSSHLEF